MPEETYEVDLLDQLLAFLGSTKTSEALSPELREAITVQTGLEAALARAVEDGRDVIVAGSAGGGKTHLIAELDEVEGTENAYWPEGEESSSPHIRVVMDMTEVPEEMRFEALDRCDACRAVVIAINEGPLLQLARDNPESGWAAARDSLHAAQRGESGLRDPSKPVVIDVGGFDPVRHGVVGRLLKLPILQALSQRIPCACQDRGACPRRQAWEWLQEDEVRNRLDSLLTVSLGREPLLFRELWEFIDDLMTGGSCATSPPESVWFWRVFFGNNVVSKRIRDAVDVAFVVFPRDEAQVWYGNLLEVETVTDEGLLPPPSWDGVRQMTRDEFIWSKCQMFFMLKGISATAVLRDQMDLALSRCIDQGRVGEVVEAVNQYMTYGTRAESRQILTLWTDFGVERRLERVRGQVALGEVPTTELRLCKSASVANLTLDSSEDQRKYEGGRNFLVHPTSGASLALDPFVLHLLQQGRSPRIIDREHTALEWFVREFFIHVASSLEDHDVTMVMTINFSSMTQQTSHYRISRGAGEVEPMVTDR